MPKGIEIASISLCQALSPFSKCNRSNARKVLKQHVFRNMFHVKHRVLS
jgi:hypothetical protein